MIDNLKSVCVGRSAAQRSFPLSSLPLPSPTTGHVRPRRGRRGPVSFLLPSWCIFINRHSFGFAGSRTGQSSNPGREDERHPIRRNRPKRKRYVEPRRWFVPHIWAPIPAASLHKGGRRTRTGNRTSHNRSTGRSIAPLIKVSLRHRVAGTKTYHPLNRTTKPDSTRTTARWLKSTTRSF